MYGKWKIATVVLRRHSRHNIRRESGPDGFTNIAEQEDIKCVESNFQYTCHYVGHFVAIRD